MSMNYDDHIYHREREQKCRELAQAASDPDVRRRHQELAELHAGRAALYGNVAAQAGSRSSSLSFA